MRVGQRQTWLVAAFALSCANNAGVPSSSAVAPGLPSADRPTVRGEFHIAPADTEVPMGVGSGTLACGALWSTPAFEDMPSRAAIGDCVEDPEGRCDPDLVRRQPLPRVGADRDPMVPRLRGSGVHT